MTDRITAVTLPRWGLSMTEGKVGSWYATPGAAVEKGADLVDVETEKIANAFEAPASGVLRRIVTDSGATVTVGALLGVISMADVPDQEIDAFVDAFVNPEMEKAEGDSGQPKFRTVEVGGRTIQYFVTGSGDAPPAILVHGFGGDANNWLFNVAALAQGRPVCALDLPGHGGSDKTPMQGGVEELAERLGGFVTALGFERVHLVGHSMGGAVAALAALAEPSRVASLSLISPLGLGAEINAEYIEGFVAADKRRQMQQVSSALFADPTLVTPEMIENLLRYKRLDGVAEALEALARGMLADGAQKTRLPDTLFASGFPVQAIWGAEDAVIPSGHGRQAPVCHVIEGAGHMAHLERATETNRLLGEFMEKADG